MTQFLCSVYNIKVSGSIRKASLVLRVLSSPGPDLASEVQSYLDYYKYIIVALLAVAGVAYLIWHFKQKEE